MSDPWKSWSPESIGPCRAWCQPPRASTRWTVSLPRGHLDLSSIAKALRPFHAPSSPTAEERVLGDCTPAASSEPRAPWRRRPSPRFLIIHETVHADCSVGSSARARRPAPAAPLDRPRARCRDAIVGFSTPSAAAVTNRSATSYFAFHAAPAPMSTGSAMMPVTVASVGHSPIVKRRTTPERRSASTMVYRRDRINGEFVGRRNGKLYQPVRLTMQAEFRALSPDHSTRHRLARKVSPLPRSAGAGCCGAVRPLIVSASWSRAACVSFGSQFGERGSCTLRNRRGCILEDSRPQGGAESSFVSESVFEVQRVFLIYMTQVWAPVFSVCRQARPTTDVT